MLKLFFEPHVRIDYTFHQGTGGDLDLLYFLMEYEVARKKSLEENDMSLVRKNSTKRTSDYELLILCCYFSL